MFATIWNDMFQLGVPVLEKILRPVIIYIFLVISLRLAGKRELAQLNPFDLVVLLTISNTVQNAIIGPDNSVTGGIIGASTLLLVNFLIIRFLFRHNKVDQVVEGDRDILIENGRVLKDKLEKELITLNELTTAAHKQGFGSLDEIDHAEIDPGGVISFVGKKSDPNISQHQDLLARLDRITQELESLRGSMQKP